MTKIKSAKKLWAFLLIFALFLCGIVGAGILTVSAEETPEAGLDESTNTYYVVGTEGYPTTNTLIQLPAGATLDLTYADNFVKPSGFSKVAVFSPQGDLTIKGDGQPISFDGRFIIYVGNLTNYTLTLDNLNWTESAPVSNDFTSSKTTAVTIQYKGNCVLPEFNYLSSEATVTFQSVESGTLSLVNFSVSHHTKSSKFVFDGGTVNVAKVIKSCSIDIINGCNLTVSGSEAIGIHLDYLDYYNLTAEEKAVIPSGLQGNTGIAKASGKLLIKDSTVSVTVGNSCNGKNIAIGGVGSSMAQYYNGWYCSLQNNLITSTVEIDNSKVTVNADNNEFGGIGFVKNIEIKNNSTVTVSANNEFENNSAIGLGTENVSISDSTVTAYAVGTAIGPHHDGFSDTAVTNYYGGTAPQTAINIINSTVTAGSQNGAAIGSKLFVYVYGDNITSAIPVSVTISGSSKIVARSVNGAGIGGGMLTKTVMDPDAVVINPSIGGWENGSSGDSIGTYSLRSSVSAVSDSGIPTDVSAYVYSAGQTLTVKATDGVTPTILAESGVCAISSETVTTDTAIIQNTVETAPSQTMPIKVGGVWLADLHKSYKSVARTANAGTLTDGTSVSFSEITAGTYGMTYGSGEDPDPLLNRIESVTPHYGSIFAIAENTFNRFWTVPQEKLGGNVTVSTESATGTAVSEAVVNTALYANISGLTPTAAQTSEMLTYQWYQNGVGITDAISNTYTPTEVGLYTCVVSGTQLYRNSVTSSMVTVKSDEAVTVPSAPEVDTVTNNSITVKASTDGTYEYSIDGGQTWQSELSFGGLASQTTYNIVRRVAVESGANTNPISTPLTVETLKDSPDVEEILALIDYENEKLSSLPDQVNFYSDEACTQLINTELTAENGLTEYIAANGENPNYIYARFTYVTGIGNDKVTSVEIPVRPAVPAFTNANVSVGITSIQVVGSNGVAYTCNNVTQNYTGSALTFSDLTEDTEYTVYARLLANNSEKRFCSEQVSLTVRTQLFDRLNTTVLIPSGTTEAVTFDLSSLIDADGNYTLPATLSVSDPSVVASVSVSGTSITVTPTNGKAGTAELTGDYTFITVKIVDTVAQNGDGSILWLWGQTTADLQEQTGALLSSDDTLGIGSTYQLIPVYAYGVNAETQVPDSVAGTVTVLLPYWGNTDASDRWILSYQNTDSVTEITALTLSADGIRLTASSGIYGLYTVVSYYSDITVEIVLSDTAYGTALNPSATVTESGFVPSTQANWSYTYSTDGLTFSDSIPENVGTYYVKAVFTDTVTRRRGTAIEQFQIKPYELKIIAVTAEDRDYDPDNTQVKITGVTFEADVLEKDKNDVTVGLTDLYGTLNSANAGSYTSLTISKIPEITGSAAENYTVIISETVTTQVTVRKVNAVLTDPEKIEGLVYNGSDQALVTEGKANGGTVKYSLDNQTWTDTVPAVKYAGDYTVYYKVAGDGNYNDHEGGFITVTVAKKSLTVTAENKTVEQYLSLLEFTYTVDGLTDGDSFVTEPSGSVNTDGKTVGSFDIVFSGGINDNYDITYVKGTLTVTEHTEHRGGNVTCTEQGECQICGALYGDVKGHTYDNACDSDCNVCGEPRTPADHTDADENGICDACNAELPKDGLSGGAIAGIAIGSTAGAGMIGFVIFWFVIKKKKWSDLFHR